MIALVGLALFLSASLLFILEPLIGKLILPSLGGTPAAWNTCVMFFQAELLAGYIYAHVSAVSLSLRKQIGVQILLLSAGLLTLPLTLHGQTPDAYQRPITSVLVMLTESVGLPLLAIAATAPLLQRWLSTTRDPSARDPFFLYAVSNFGSLLALLAYPFVIEPTLRLTTQRRWWSAGYVALLSLTVACAWAIIRQQAPVTSNDRPSDNSDQAEATRTVWSDRQSRQRDWIGRVRWAALAFVPSSLMLGVTTFISTDIAAVPLLWVLPLSLYLLTYVLAFARRRFLPLSWLIRLLPFAVIAALYFFFKPVGVPLWETLAAHLGTLFIAAYVCHAELADERPVAAELTEYYLWIGVGGLLGGVFNTIVAPIIFTRTVEYPMALVLAVLLRAKRGAKLPPLITVMASLAVASLIGILALKMPTSMRLPFSSVTMRGELFTIGVPLVVALALVRRPSRFALALTAIVVANLVRPDPTGELVYQERTFFGVHRVLQHGDFHLLLHGTTTHGAQSTRPERECSPLTYYARSGPVGQLFESFTGSFVKHHVASVGLGAATIGAYAQPDQQWTFFEINPAVERIAQNPRYFTYLRDCTPHYRIVTGDARLEIAREPDQAFDVMLFDAFSSDAIPLHLMTREALALYLRKLSAHGVLVFHISNRHLDLRAPLGDLARDAALSAYVEEDTLVSPVEAREGKYQSIWVAMARDRGDFGDLLLNPQWRPLPTSGRAVWTDDYSNLLAALRLGL